MNVEQALNFAADMEGQHFGIDPALLHAAMNTLTTELRRLRDENMSLLGIIADIRAAVGDPGGVMMLSELIEHCREIYVDADRLRAREAKARELMERIIRDATVYYDVGMYVSDATRWLAEGE